MVWSGPPTRAAPLAAEGVRGWAASVTLCVLCRLLPCAAGAAALDQRVAALEKVVQTQSKAIASLRAELARVDAAIADIQDNHALALGPYLSVTGGALKGVRGPHVLFTAVTVHVRSGSGAIDDNAGEGGTLTGLGNLIVRYDKPVGGGGAGPQPRTGSNCLVVVSEHTWQSYGGFVAGWRNLILAPWATVSGGEGNTASGPHASISGGVAGMASGFASSVSGDSQSHATGEAASVSGGTDVDCDVEHGWAAGGYRSP